MGSKRSISVAFLLLFFVIPPVEGTTTSYADFTFDASVLPLEAAYDYIVVGGGTAGCPLAATLSESHRVLVLERGGAPEEFPSVGRQDGFLRTLLEEEAPDSPAQFFVSQDGVPNSRGRVVGGSSAINAGFYSHAHATFFDRCGAGGTVTAWDMALVNESYNWVERALVFRPVLRSWQEAVRDGLLEAEVTPYNGFTLEHVAGTKIGGSTFDSNGRRHSAADLLGFANPANIQVAIRATVERILLSPIPRGAFLLSPALSSLTLTFWLMLYSYTVGLRGRSQNQVRAVGVEYRDRKGHRHRAMTRVGGEVILSAGALGSPQLLLLSGVGLRQYLSAWGIPVALNLPDVGQHMYDNPRNGISFVPSVRIEQSLTQVVGIPRDDAAFIEAASNVMPFLSPSRTAFLSHPSFPLFMNVATVMAKVAGPLSSGSLRLASLDARDNPLVRFNYFARVEDLARCVNGVRRLRDVLYGRSMARLRMRSARRRRDFRFVGPTLPRNMSNNVEVARFCRRTVATLWHYHGGCVSGKVVDGEFRVMGAAALRVVDGSIFNVSPGTNPQATLMMMGR
ncbi:hypothetical protein Cni_G07004 [Canna indica]|uniref:Glucose-methanol-choline oxidoreductase N-terminal domain-containing protein n=1 Tax=Canna indica TaxID=4628 RepID=A0AAQ3JZM5_9LILI|nr:hypothetical protein Cni_G07004 [Canna indica]